MVQRRARNSNRGTKPRRRVLARTRNGFTQSSTAASRQDNVPHLRKFQIFETLPFSNASLDYSVGLSNFNIESSSSPMKEILTSYSAFYEQYRIKKVLIRAQVGKGYTNDRRIQTLVGARVDVDKQVSGATVANVQSINASENCIIKTFTERGNILLARFRPQCRINTTASLPILPNQFQYYPINDFQTHTWKGATITCLIPEPNLSVNELQITLVAEVDVEFRGRITTPIIFNNSTINQSPQPITYDLRESQDVLRNSLLTGAYFPLTAWPINIGNIGHTVTAAEIIGLTFRRQSDMKKFEIEMYENGDYGANEIQPITLALSPLIL